MYPLYTIALIAGLLVASPWWLAAMLFSGKYREGLAERLGAVPDRVVEKLRGRRPVWVHAVSVGELLAAAPLIAKLQAALDAAGFDVPVVVSTTTRAGQQLAREKFGEAAVFYFPLDFPWAVDHYLRLLRPRLVVLLETEFWPNFLRAAERRQARVLVANARISDRSFGRYLALRGLWRRFLAPITLGLAQTAVDARRLQRIGLAGPRLRVAGNLKYDALPDQAREPAIVSELRRHLPAGAPVWICGSTGEGEEEILLAAHRRALPAAADLVTVLAPRRPERFAAVAAMLPEPALRRSQWMQAPHAIAPGSVFLLDSIGELAQVYALATLAFVGGSLLRPGGGHNPLEPAALGVPVLAGPYMQNFRDVARGLERAGALSTVDAEHLPETLVQWLADRPLLKERGARAREHVEAHGGAVERTVQQILRMLTPAAGPEIRWLAMDGAAEEP